MFKKILLVIALSMGIFSTAKADTTSVYKVDGSVRNLVAEFVDVPEMLQNANIKVTITAYPKQRYYKSEIKLLQPFNKVCGFTKTLEIWDEQKIVRTSVDIDLNLRLRFLKRIIEPRIEDAILFAEKKFLDKRLTK